LIFDALSRYVASSCIIDLGSLSNFKADICFETYRIYAYPDSDKRNWMIPILSISVNEALYKVRKRGKRKEMIRQR
jgi:hypothetical protein